MGVCQNQLSIGAKKLPLIGFNDKSAIETSDNTIRFLNLNLDARFQYKAFFIDLAAQFNNLGMGFTLASSGSGNLELLVSNVFDDIERDNVSGLESIVDRDADFNLGLRSSIYLGDNTLQLELMRDVSDAHDGVIGALHIGRQKQIRNWNLHGLLGVRYFSEKVVDYYLGVSAQESTSIIPQYNGKAGILPSVQVTATYPLNEKWLFQAQADYLHLPDSVVDSPLAQGDSLHGAEVGIVYVFGGR